LWLAYALWASRSAEQKPWAWRLLFLAALQLLTGLSNVVLGWPLVAAVVHTGGAAALAIVLTLMLSRLASSDKIIS
jgi:cytochrome c oxidase assembly protein subunit 15